jgi:regulatory protein SWI6
LSAEFSSEIKTKQDTLDVTQAHLRAATRELSEQRRQIQLWQSKCTEMDQLGQRARNLRKVLDDEEKFDWTGRTDLDGKDARDTAGPSFRALRESRASPLPSSFLEPAAEFETDPPLPEENTAASLIRLRRLRLWHLRMETLLNERLKSLQGANLVKESQCKKIVALCAGIPVDKVEDVSFSHPWMR